MCTAFNGNPRATNISSNSPINVSEETDLIAFYNELSSLVRSIQKHNGLSIGGDINAQMVNNMSQKFNQQNSSNRNGEHLTDFTQENRLTYLNAEFQKRKGKLWTYTFTNYPTAQIDYVLINKIWNNSALKCEAYSSFEGVSSDHRTVTLKIRLRL